VRREIKDVTHGKDGQDWEISYLVGRCMLKLIKTGLESARCQRL